MQLELRRWHVEAPDDLGAQLIVAPFTFQHFRPVLRILKECLRRAPKLLLHGVQELQALGGIGKKKPPVGNVVLGTDAVQVARAQCEHVVEDQHIGRLPSQGYGVWEALLRFLHTHQKCAENILGLADRDILQARAARIARRHRRRTRLAALLASLDVVVQGGGQLGMLRREIVDGPFECWRARLAGHGHEWVWRAAVAKQILRSLHQHPTVQRHLVGHWHAGLRKLVTPSSDATHL
mmetsp:Transcript_60061/g.173144  ORF Transcript_60061/g.173144 Transcript_60061/m.173144 type:complete len:237 (+) Transcript_60061:723-1433(+)